MERAKYHCRRIVQLLPADGWFGVWADEKPGEYFTERIMALALVERWHSDDFHSVRFQSEDGDEYEGQFVLPVTRQDDYLDIEDTHGSDATVNFVGIWHQDDMTQADVRQRIELHVTDVQQSLKRSLAKAAAATE